MSDDLWLTSSESTTFSSNLYVWLEEYLFKKNAILLVRKNDKTLILKDDLDWQIGSIQKMDDEQDLELQILRFFSEAPKTDNIIFENGLLAMLYQNKHKTHQIKLADKKGISILFRKFFSYQSPQKRTFDTYSQTIQTLFTKIFTHLQSILPQHLEKKNLQKEKLFRYYHQHIKPSTKTSDIAPSIYQHVLTADFWIALEPSLKNCLPFPLLQSICQDIFLETSHYQDFVSLKRHYVGLAELIIQSQKKSFIPFITQLIWGNAGIFKLPKTNSKEIKMVHFVLKFISSLWEKYYQTPFLGNPMSFLVLSENFFQFSQMLPQFFPQHFQKKIQHQIVAYEKNLLTYYQNQSLQNTSKPFHQLSIHYTWANELLDNSATSAQQPALFGDNMQEKTKKMTFQLIFLDEKQLYTTFPSESFKEVIKVLGAEKNMQSKQVLQTYAYFKWATERLDKKGILIIQMRPEIWQLFRAYAMWDLLELKFGNIYAIETSELVFLYCIK